MLLSLLLSALVFRVTPAPLFFQPECSTPEKYGLFIAAPPSERQFLSTVYAPRYMERCAFRNQEGYQIPMGTTLYAYETYRELIRIYPTYSVYLRYGSKIISKREVGNL